MVSLFHRDVWGIRGTSRLVTLGFLTVVKWEVRMHAAGVKENLCDFFFSSSLLMLSSLIRMGTCHGATGYHGVARIVCQLVGATLKNAGGNQMSLNRNSA